MAPKMTQEEYWAWYAAATGRQSMFTTEEKEEPAVSSVNSECHLTLISQVAAAKTLEEALTLCKQHEIASMPFSGAVDVVYGLTKKHRWKNAWANMTATGAVERLTKKIAHGIDNPAKLSPDVACKAVYALGKYNMLEEKELKAFQKHAEAHWDTKSMDAAHAAHFVWACVRMDIKLEHGVLMALINTIQGGCKHLSYSDMAEITWAVQKGATTVGGSVTRTTHEDALFESIAKRLIDDIDKISPVFLVDIIHNFASLGLKNERLLSAICPKLLAANLHEALMAKCIKAYTRFSVPFRDSSQGYRQTAIVLKGDYQRPSDRPPKKKQKHNKPTNATWGN